MKKIITPLPLFLLVATFLISLPCDRNLSCSGKAMDILQYPGFWFLILIPLSLLALMLNGKKYKIWLKTTVMFFIASMILVFMMPEYPRGLMLNPDREFTNWFLIGIYFIFSVIFFIAYFVNKKSESIQNKV